MGFHWESLLELNWDFHWDFHWETRRAVLMAFQMGPGMDSYLVWRMERLMG